MGIGSKIGDMLNMRTPHMLDCPGSEKARVRQLLAQHGYADIRFGKSGNRGFLGLGRYLDVFPRRDQHWEVYQVLLDNGYQNRTSAY